MAPVLPMRAISVAAVVEVRLAAVAMAVAASDVVVMHCYNTRCVCCDMLLCCVCVIVHSSACSACSARAKCGRCGGAT